MIKNKQPLAVSIIIPAYNEEDYLEACLNSIADQTVGPLEVIVIDNNSFDKTVEIAKRFPFVEILHESRQHQSFAQKTGFEHAQGEIIGRIDADTILPEDWVEKIMDHFAQNPDSVGVSGSALPYDMLMGGLSKFGFETFIGLARRIAGHKLMWGANCAFRKKAYQNVETSLADRHDIWEDFDLSFVLSKLGKIDYLDNIDVLASFRAVHKPLSSQLEYQYRAVRTFALHKNRFITTVFFVSWFSLFAAYPFVILDRKILQPIKQMSLLYVDTSEASSIKQK